MTLGTRVAEVLPVRISRLTIPLLIVALVLLALFSPSAETDQTYDPRLSSLLAGPNGAKGLYDVARGLGWRTQQRKRNPLDSLGEGTIVAVLAPPIPLSERETSLLLQRVRDGASLLAVIERESPLADSLHLDLAPRFVMVSIDSLTNLKCAAGQSRSAFQFIGSRAPLRPFSQTTRAPPGSTIFLVSSDRGFPENRFAAVGFPFGKGRIVAVSDPNALRNDFIRICSWGLGLTDVRMLEYLSAGAKPSRTRLVFDEFHQGFGPQPSITRAATEFLFKTAPGAVLAQLIIASLVFLLAIAPRAIPPAPSFRAQRRSQFEHVEALSSAYSQISATRTVTERLVRGVRRRLAGGPQGSARQRDTDAIFLERVAAAYPQVSTDVALVSAALTRSSSSSELIAAVEAIEKIERTIKL